MYIYTREKKYHYIYGALWNKNTKKNKKVKFYLGKEPIYYSVQLIKKIEKKLGTVPEHINQWLYDHGYAPKYRERLITKEEVVDYDQEREEEKSNKDANKILTEMVNLASVLKKRPLSKLLGMFANKDKVVIQQTGERLVQHLQDYLNEPIPLAP